MNTKEMICFLDFMAKHRTWLFSFQDALLYFKESPATLKASLRRHIENDLICRVTRNLYANPRSVIKGSKAAGELAAALRPGKTSYLSLEALLSECGAISQVCCVFTFMTTGRKGSYDTRFGRIEFEHFTGEIPFKNIAWNEDRYLWLASPFQAWHDFQKKRPESLWHIVDMGDLEEAQEDFLEQISNIQK